MKRRLLLAASLATSTRLALGGAAYFALFATHSQPSYTVTTAQLQDAIAKRFPLRKRAEGILDITVQAPQLRMLTAQNRLGAVMAVEAGGPVLRRAYPGTFDLDFALRYEASDMTIRAHELRVNALQFDGLPPQASMLLGSYGPQLAEQALQGAVLHTLKPQDLALPDSMGVQPSTITVTDKGLVIAFVNKPVS
ncbi:hypothetical protein SAMN05216350_10431 [Polaromonas sp. YR568]|uniref:DUF1439 domain-containing protein n=1 Tax=Polaromonas sp. YR568 TaxID=1855301 RepID=UPI0008E84EBC|nr:DUF1439 domain-containing protein [Polaromonas sp. YR568]SFU70234.1 hypothetical protein SAMN05216350_10431 [Polaromonas sp. YR568]